MLYPVEEELRECIEGLLTQSHELDEVDYKYFEERILSGLLYLKKKRYSKKKYSDNSENIQWGRKIMADEKDWINGHR